MATNPLPVDDESVRLLGRGALRHFAGLYPHAIPSPQFKILDIARATGSQKAAAALIGVNPRTLRKWAQGATPKAASLAKIDKAYNEKTVRDAVFANRLKDNGFTPQTTIEARLYEAILNGETTAPELGAILAKFMIDGGVPTPFVVLKPPRFTTGMHDIDPSEGWITISTDGDRGDWPFHIGTY